MTKHCHFIEPLDVLFLRGNKLFGDPGSFGESLVPPWPSVAAGAMRSALLAHKGVDIHAFANNNHEDPELGTPQKPGPFVLTAFQLARWSADSASSPEPLIQVPADLVVRKGKDGDGTLHMERLRPVLPQNGIRCSGNTSSLAVLAETSRGKPESGFWLGLDGWKKYLAGERVEPADLLRSSDLWRLETRVGVGLDAVQRRAADGALFSTQAVSLNKSEHSMNSSSSVGFLAESTGAKFPENFALRLGGDGRGALAKAVNPTLVGPDFESIAASGRCRLVLMSPGIFENGWMPTGTSGSGLNLDFDLHGVRGRLSCAAVSRAETVSGFDVAKKKPKPAQRVAPSGSVYWLEELEATPNDLRALAERGLWSTQVEDPVRRAEGFNRLTIAAY